MERKTVAIIGGGAAGMMAGVGLIEEFERTGKQYPQILLFEKNAYLGAKVLISGGGRCNVTTGIHDIKKLLENYPRGAKFLRTAMHDFPPEGVMEWFELHGVKLKTEKDLRVFPVSDNGKDVVGALEKVLKHGKAEIHLNANVTKIETIENADDANIPKKRFRIHTKIASYDVDDLILTTGGNAYRQTGSTGDGYAFSSALEHTITPLAPSLSSFMTQEIFPAKLSGVSFERAEITLISHDSKRTFKRTGPFLFTHKGVSGPSVFAVSGLAAYENFSKEKPMQLTINFFPDESERELTERFQKLANEHGKKRLVNLLDMFMPKSWCEIIVHELHLDPDIQASKISKELKTKIIEYLHALPLKVVGPGAGDEFVSAGGVSLDEVNPNTMESRICPGLYFAGELLDIDGFTGGFNLQASWATGKLAAKGIAKR